MISLIFGLGNPGKKYAGTRHNVGYDVVSTVASRLRATPQPPHDLYQWSTFERPASRIVLAWPTTFMNLSGHAVTELLAETQIDLANILVVVDDFNLSLGTTRIRSEGSDGGHNGLASIIESIGSQQFARVRVGLGPLLPDFSVIDFVLSRFSEAERVEIDKAVDFAAEACIFALDNPLETTMSKYNRNPALPENS